MRTYIYSLCFVALYYYETLFYIHVVLSSNHVLVIIQIKLLPLLLSTLLPLLLLLLLLLLFGFVFLQIFPHALFYHFQFRVQFSVFSFLLFYFCMSFFVYFLYPCRNCFFFRLCKVLVRAWVCVRECDWALCKFRHYSLCLFDYSKPTLAQLRACLPNAGKRSKLRLSLHNVQYWTLCKVVCVCWSPSKPKSL
jgi:hypothetical protein